MSLAFDTGRPFACSGAMYAAVPRMTPTPVTPIGLVSVGECVIAIDDVGVVAFPLSGGPSALARPKSSTFTVPSARTFTFAGFKSR